MKTHTYKSLKVISVSLSLVCSLAARNVMGFAGDTWDPQGTAGGQPTSGAWESAKWSTLTTEGAMATPVNWVEGGAALFAFGATGGSTTKLTITMASNHTVAGLFNGPLIPASCFLTVNPTNGGGGMVLPTSLQGFSTGGSTLGQTTLNVPISGVGGIQTQSGGSIFLYGTNTYSGGTSIIGTGGVNFNNNNSFGTGAITWATNAILATPATDGNGSTGATAAITISNAVNADTHPIIIVGTNFPLTFSGPWSLPASGTVAIQYQPASSGTVSNLTLSGVISGAAGFSKIGAGTIVLSGANTYSGRTWVSNGVLSVASFNKVSGGSASSSLGHPTTTANGTISIGSGATTGITLVYTGAGETTDRVIDLSGTTAGVSLQADGAGALVLSSDFTATGAGAKTLTITGSSAATNTIAGKIVNSTLVTSVTKAGTGTWILSGANTYTGNTTLTGTGLFGIGNAAALNTGALVMGGTSPFDNLTGSDLTITNAFTISGGSPTYVGSANNMTITGPVAISGATRTVTVTANTLTLSAGVTQDSQRNFTKAGNGTLVLLGTNGYTGTNAINAGTLALGGNSSIAGSAVIVSSTATLANTSTNTRPLGGSLTFNSGSHASFTAVNGSVGSMSVVSNVTFNTGTLPTFTVNVSGPSLTAGTYPLITTAAAVSGSPNATPTITGTALSAGLVPFVVTNSTAANLVIDTTPVAGPASYARPSGVAFKIAISDLLTNASDVDPGDTVSFVSIGATSTNGAALTNDSTFVYYTPSTNNPPNVTDAFTYTVKDSFGVTASGTVTVTITSDNTQSVNITGMSTLGDGTTLLSFAGIPGYTYLVQGTTNLTPTIIWTTLGTNVAGTNGLFQFNDLDSTNFGTRYYRTTTP